MTAVESNGLSSDTQSWKAEVRAPCEGSIPLRSFWVVRNSVMSLVRKNIFQDFTSMDCSQKAIYSIATQNFLEWATLTNVINRIGFSSVSDIHINSFLILFQKSELSGFDLGNVDLKCLTYSALISYW